MSMLAGIHRVRTTAMAIQNKRFSWVVLLIAAGLHLLALSFIAHYTTTFPLAIDEWIHLVPRHVEFLEGTLTPQAALSMQSAVVDAPPALFFYTWLLTLPNVVLFRWNLHIDSFANYLLMATNSVLILYLLTREQRQVLAALILPVTAFMLAVQQRWNFLVGAHIAIPLQVFFVLLTFIFVMHPRQSLTKTILGTLIAFVGTFASFVGWMTWFLIFPALWLLGYRRWKPYLIYGLGAIAAALVLVNVPGFNVSGGHYITGVSMTAPLTNVSNYALFIFAYLGGIFGTGADFSLAVSLLLGMMGLTTLVINILSLWRTDSHRAFVAVCAMLAAYGLAYGVMAAVGRVDQFGVRGGLQSHYIGFAVLFWCGLSGLVALTLWDAISSRATRSCLAVFNLILTVLVAIYYLTAAYTMMGTAQAHTARVAEMEQCIREVATNPQSQSEGCEVIGGLALSDWIQALHKHRLTGFSDS